MDISEGLKSEAKALEAVQELQRRNWSHKGYLILKAARTYRHPNDKIRKLESKKVDLVIVFRDPNGHPAVFVLQIKSTPKSFRHFCNNSKHANIKCLLVLKHEIMEDVMPRLKKILEEVIDTGGRKNRFFRRKIDIKLL
ncbi:MAG: hypothetical protein A2745_00220 [Candidatus Harrisonbacteria bacterium RIFCSPHIGHO2_01_FULL_44_13]|uniref:Uncharacterized protein n=1 Tax=Candidatus Harrisonbacteria bacterium RIFCSPLOWO2_01_FULL_44_18 TaxID=1798407 RepID=A0A1G1ZMX5_9BACT|nr:MAG: hypothetical protein A2745_00220 [Candidatus Harrisonbacteria bacterium RIFCSPHIGHO2_01_FULL_44_13]OGY65924.1 MAG: hypothetical protein A3A16_00875 [Candidatus Harrisonbacteria bacterium RIFCSPLOWO2_01_FULL_44_18]